MAVVAVDAGGSIIKVGLVENGRVLVITAFPAQSHLGLAFALERIADTVRGFSSVPVEVGALEGIGMAFPSLIDGDRILGAVGKYQDAEGIDLQAWARKEFDLPFAVENDARMAAIGEWQYGAARGKADVVMVTLGTGIGVGVISEGRVLRGRHGAAAILGGHMTARIGGRPCPCGSVGCWETEASTVALPAMARELGLGFGGGTYDYHDVFTQTGPVATGLRERSLEVWGALAVSLVHAYDPEMLVFGGGVMASGEAVLGPIREAVDRHAWTPWGNPAVVASELGDAAALVACEWLVRDRKEREK